MAATCVIKDNAIKIAKYKSALRFSFVIDIVGLIKKESKETQDCEFIWDVCGEDFISYININDKHPDFDPGLHCVKENKELNNLVLFLTKKDNKELFIVNYDKNLLEIYDCYNSNNKELEPNDLFYFCKDLHDSYYELKPVKIAEYSILDLLNNHKVVGEVIKKSRLL